MSRWNMSNDEYAGFVKAAFEDAVEEILSAHEGISKGASWGSALGRLGGGLAPILGGAAIGGLGASALGLDPVTGALVGAGGGWGAGRLGRGMYQAVGTRPSSLAAAQKLIADKAAPAGMTAEALAKRLDAMAAGTRKMTPLGQDFATAQQAWMRPRAGLGALGIGGGLYGGKKMLFDGSGGGAGGEGGGMLGLGGTGAGAIAGGALGGYGTYQLAKMLDMPEWARWAAALGGAGVGSQVL